MNVLARVGSERKNGNTARVVQMVEARMRALASSRCGPLEFETLFLADHDVARVEVAGRASTTEKRSARVQTVSRSSARRWTPPTA